MLSGRARPPAGRAPILARPAGAVRTGATTLATIAQAPEAPAAEERPKADRLFRNVEFLRIWGGQTISSVGSGVVKIAAPLLVLALGESPTMAGLVGGALMFPMIFLGLPAGALVDRWDRRKVMIVCDTSRCIAVMTVPLAWMLGLLTGWWLLAVALALGSAQSFYNICQVAALPRVVQKRQIASAQALNSTSEAVAQLASPGLGGMIVQLAPTAVIGGVLAYCVNGGTFMVSVLALLGIRTPFQASRPRAGQAGIMQSIRDGLHYVWREYAIRMLMVLNTVHRFGFAPVMLTVVVLARQDLGFEPAQIGLLFSVAGSGGLSAAAITPWLRRRIPVGWHMIGIVGVHALALALVTVSSSVLLIGLGLYFAGMMETMTGITQVSYRLALIPDAIQGRVNSVYRLLSFGAMSFGTALGGFLIDLYGPRPVMGLIAGWIGLMAVAGALSGVRSLRE
ncbi:MAG: MFS transporter [Chloroflexi bacterium]|nr:MFS transporter [Chloroflexota bacterium]